MGADHSTALTFNLEETVWLDQGQRMKELLSLALEPDIHIEERQEYVAIKGGLRLKGEYLPTADNRTHLSDQHSSPPQYTERNIKREDGVGEIHHYFPVDVTIPLRRIHNLDDVYVQIDGFDYDLPESDCIQLTADVSITGMKSEETEESNKERETPKTVEMPAPLLKWDIERKTKQVEEEEEIEESLQDNVEKKREENKGFEENEEREKSQEQEEEEPEGPEEPEVMENSDALEDQEQEITPRAQERESDVLDKNEKEDSDEEAKGESTVQELGDMLEDRDREHVTSSDNDEADGEHREEQQEAVEEIVTAFHSREEEEDKEVIDEVVVMEEEREEREQEEVTEEVQEETLEDKTDIEEEEKQRDENALYLTKVMTESEEEFSRVKMCIIQENESLDTIAERYELTMPHLLRYNRLDNEYVEEGQILYIPVSGGRKKKNEQ